MTDSAPFPSTKADAHERILVVDFGSQVTQLIARRLREGGVYCEVHPFNKVDSSFLSNFSPKGIILSGGPASVKSITSPRADEAVFTLGVSDPRDLLWGTDNLCAAWR